PWCSGQCAAVRLPSDTESHRRNRPFGEFVATDRASANRSSPETRLIQHIHQEDLMNWNQIQGNWKQFKGRVKEKWGELTDDEIEQIQGRRDQLVGKIEQHYGVARDEAESQVRQWENSL